MAESSVWAAALNPGISIVLGTNIGVFAEVREGFKNTMLLVKG